MPRSEAMYPLRSLPLFIALSFVLPLIAGALL